jgi:hemoglobin
MRCRASAFSGAGTVDWTPTETGPTALLAQATDRTGHQQPDRVPFNRDGYLDDGIARLPVTVSQPGAEVVERAPVPRWGWGVALPYQP